MKVFFRGLSVFFCLFVPAWISAAPASAEVSCEKWNTQEFFEKAGAADVTRCLVAGAGIDVRHSFFKMMPIHFAAAESKTPEVITTLLNAGAKVSTKVYGTLTPLFYAGSYNDNPAVVTTLVKAGADVKVKDIFGGTPLHHAVEHNDNPEVVKALLKAGAEVNAIDKHGKTPLVEAARKANPAVIIALIKAGAYVNAKDKFNKTLLQMVASRATPGLITALMKVGADVNARDGTDGTPLHNAAFNENPAVITTLVRAGADVKVKDKFGKTPLHYAVKHNDNPEVVKALLQAGVDVNVMDKTGATPLHYATRNVNPPKPTNFSGLYSETRKYFMRVTKEVTKNTDWKLERTNPAVITALMKAGADVNAKDNSGYTPLYYAIYAAMFSPNPVFVEALLESGAKLDIMAGDEGTLLHYAALSDNPAFITALLQAGVNIDARDKDGATPLLHAVRNLDSVEFGTVLERRLKLLGYEHLGNELRYTRRLLNTNPAVITALLKAGADVNVIDNYGFMPLHYAAMYDGPTAHAMEAMLDAGADPAAKDKSGNSAWDYAEHNKYFKWTNAYKRLKEKQLEKSRRVK